MELKPIVKRKETFLEYASYGKIAPEDSRSVAIPEKLAAKIAPPRRKKITGVRSRIREKK